MFINLYKFQTSVTTVFCYRSNITDLSKSALSFLPDKIDSEYRNINYLLKDRLCMADVLSLYLLNLIYQIIKTGKDKLCTVIIKSWKEWEEVKRKTYISFHSYIVVTLVDIPEFHTAFTFIVKTNIKK